MKPMGATRIFFRTLRMQMAQMIENIGLEPRLGGRTAAALKDEFAACQPAAADTSRMCFAELFDVVAGVGHGAWNAVRGCDEMNGTRRGFGKLLER